MGLGLYHWTMDDHVLQNSNGLGWYILLLDQAAYSVLPLGPGDGGEDSPKVEMTTARMRLQSSRGT